MTTYLWKPEARLRLDPQVAGEELERLRVFNNGRLEPATVVEASRLPSDPLHDAFEWNDAVAADAYRVEQAGYLIRMITVIAEPEQPDARPIRAFVSVKRDDDRSYTSVAHAMSDVDLRAQVISQAWAELEAWRRRHAELIEFAKVFSAIDQARDAE
jgi:hypothetical protein